MTVQQSHALLEARGLERKSPQNGKVLLQDASIVIRPGDRIVLRGASGSGKTVLLRALAELDATTGDLLFRGKQIAAKAVPAFRAKNCYLHQTAVLPEGTVKEALQEPFHWTSHADKEFDDAHVATWLKSLGKGDEFLEMLTVNLSGGETQIVAIIRALLLSPDILLLDEPTSALDEKTATLLENLLLHWVNDGRRAFVWATHDKAQAGRVGSRTIEMARGTMVNG